jgi:rhodanese-related sulfurtransferase
MFSKLINLPFKVLGGVARAVQAQEAKKWDVQAEQDAISAGQTPNMDISVPDDFKPGPIAMSAKNAVALLKIGCVVDASEGPPEIPGALHIPWTEIGIRIAELPPNTPTAVVSNKAAHAKDVVRFLRHRGLDETWAMTGGLAAWKKAGGPTGASNK